MRLFSTKSGQMELIGLVVIVVLITIAFLFLAQFALQDQPEKKIFTRKQLATSTLTALMTMTTTDCEQDLSPAGLLQIEGGLLDDCAENRDFTSRYTCGDQHRHSCIFLEEELFPHLLKETLGRWNKRYELESVLVSQPEDPLLQVISQRGSCQGRERDVSGDFFLDTDVGLVRTVLYVCD